MMQSKPQKKRYSLRRLFWIGLAAAATACICVSSLLRSSPNDNAQASSTNTALVVIETTTADNTARESTPAGPAQFVDMILRPDLQGNTLLVQGTAELPDHAILMYEVSHQDMLSMTDVPFDHLVTDGFIEVMNQNFTKQIDLTGWPAGTLEVWVGFQTILGTEVKQPPEIIERYGEMGEFLFGENVTENGGFKRAEVTEVVEYSP